MVVSETGFFGLSEAALRQGLHKHSATLMPCLTPSIAFASF